MARKFSELTPSEQLRFNSLVSFMSETWNERIEVKLDIVQRFNLDIGDSVVMDFLTGVYVPPAPPPMPVKDDIPPPPKPRPPHESPDRLDPPIPIADFFKEQTMTAQEPSLPVVAPVNQAKKIKKREMTYANSEDLIIIQNRLLHAISHLTLNERRLILFLSPIVRKQIEKDPNNRVFYVYVQDFIDEYGIKSKKYYGELEKIADSIVEKAFFFWYTTSNGKAKKGVSWVSECDYIENEGMIKIRLDNTVIEMLTVFDKATGHFWTQYQKEWIINLGAYGIIMLEMILSSIENKGYYTTKHLREKFDCVDTYKKFSDFKLYVIDKSISEVHKYTPIRISYETHKKGRAVIGLTFSYIDTSVKAIKNKEKTDDKSKENNPFVNFKMTPKQLAVFGSKIAKKIDKDIEIIIDEMSNVHLQGQYVDYLKELEFVPSDWYNETEIKEHLTKEQIDETKKQVKKKQREENAILQAQLEKDYQKIKLYAKEFVLANKSLAITLGEIQALKQEDYELVLNFWHDKLISPSWRTKFNLVDAILAR